MSPNKRRHVNPAEIFILMVIALIVLVVMTHNFGSIDKLYERLYSGTSVFIAVIMLVEYLLLKGADRSPIPTGLRPTYCCRIRIGHAPGGTWRSRPRAGATR